MAWIFNPFTGTFDYSIISAGGVLPPSSGGTGTSTVFTAGSVVFAGTSGIYSQDNANFFWDDANNRLGIGTATPATSLHVVGNIRVNDTNSFQWGGNAVYITGSNAAQLMQFFQFGTEVMRLVGANNVSIGTTTTAAKLTVTQTGAGSTCAYFTGVSGAKLLLDYIGNGTNYYDAGPHIFRSVVGAEFLRIDTSGNVGIGTSSTASAKLSISGAGTAAAIITTGLSSANTLPDIYINRSSSTTAVVTAPSIYLADGTYNRVIQSGAGNLQFLRYSGSWIEDMRLDTSGNLLVGTTSSPTSGTQCLTIETGTAATASPADTITIYSTDLSAGNTMLSLYTEGTPVNANATAAATHRIAIRVNGTVYYLLANTSA